MLAKAVRECMFRVIFSIEGGDRGVDELGQEVYEFRREGQDES